MEKLELGLKTASIKYRVTRKRSRNKYDASSRFDNFDFKEGSGSLLSLEVFDKNEELEVRTRQYKLRNYNTDSILRPHFVSGSNEKVFSITEKFGKHFSRWLKQPGKAIWDLSWDQKKVLGLGSDAAYVFRQIGDAMWTIISNDDFHGNLLDGVRISKDQKVKLCNMNMKFSDLEEHRIDDRILEDIAAFKKLLQMMVQSNPPSVCLLPCGFKLFYRICDIAGRKYGVELREWCYFIFKNALFFDPVRRVNFYFKVRDYAAINDHEFERNMKFNSHKDPAGIPNWMSMLEEPRFALLKVVRDYNYEVFEKDHSGVYLFHRHAFVHVDEQKKGRSRHRSRRLVTDRMLQEAIPEFMPCFFYKLATKILGVQHVFCGSLVTFLEER